MSLLVGVKAVPGDTNIVDFSFELMPDQEAEVLALENNMEAEQLSRDVTVDEMVDLGSSIEKIQKICHIYKDRLLKKDSDLFSEEWIQGCCDSFMDTLDQYYPPDPSQDEQIVACLGIPQHIHQGSMDYYYVSQKAKTRERHDKKKGLLLYTILSTVATGEKPLAGGEVFHITNVLFFLDTLLDNTLFDDEQFIKRQGWILHRNVELLRDVDVKDKCDLDDEE
ncbi:hypothetical protein FRC01_004757 [Tulasnella sp. 417]|nr:hypothetical protein FRC01_004757 [Tulasnella sp. 417]